MAKFQGTPEFWDSQPLGQVADADLAQQLGCCVSTVTDARRARKIPKLHDRRKDPGRHGGLLWQELPLGQMPDAKLAAKLGVTKQRVQQMRKKYGIPPFRQRFTKEFWESQPLGQIPDAELAGQLGCGVETVTKARRKRLIFIPRNRKSKWDEQPLGKIADEILAQQLGCSVANVAQARSRRKIPTCNDGRKLRWHKT